jgi:hypothetical protein|nr:MAG: hypothetical protein KatS3mg041_1260 [Bacteroidota bacterium]
MAACALRYWWSCLRARVEAWLGLVPKFGSLDALRWCLIRYLRSEFGLIEQIDLPDGSFGVAPHTYTAGFRLSLERDSEEQPLLLCFELEPSSSWVLLEQRLERLEQLAQQVADRLRGYGFCCGVDGRSLWVAVRPHLHGAFTEEGQAAVA